MITRNFCFSAFFSNLDLLNKNIKCTTVYDVVGRIREERPVANICRDKENEIANIIYTALILEFDVKQLVSNMHTRQ